MAGLAETAAPTGLHRRAMPGMPLTSGAAALAHPAGVLNQHPEPALSTGTDERGDEAAAAQPGAVDRPGRDERDDVGRGQAEQQPPGARLAE